MSTPKLICAGGGGCKGTHPLICEGNGCAIVQARQATPPSSPTDSEMPTPRTDAAEDSELLWNARNLEATMRGSHLDSDDMRPPDGWETARTLERELASRWQPITDAPKD